MRNSNGEVFALQKHSLFTISLMPEQQNIEYKRSWHDDYLKWVCGFANAHGGTIFIGKDDGGETVSVADYKKLMDDLPNKIRDVLGIMAEVRLEKLEW